MGVDLASSEAERADWTARVIVAEDDEHNHWVLGSHRAKIETGHNQFVKDGFAAFPGISRAVIETNQHQSTLVQDLLNTTSLPVVGRRTDQDKRTRARAVSARYESHRVHHHRSMKGGELESEMLGFPKGHDDLIDALGLAMDVLQAQGSFAAVSAAPRQPDSTMDGGLELRFNTGPQVVPGYIANMLSGIDTASMTYEEALMTANRAAESNYVAAAMGSMFRGR
jgi:predicted phage terminase large subunit-like protein